MYIGIALLVNREISNFARKLTYEMTKNKEVGIETALLPQHISLKISFEAEDIDKIEAYVDALSKKQHPFNITFSKIEQIQVVNGEKSTEILWMKVKENDELRNLHNQINISLANEMAIPLSSFDGDKFQFHSTLAYSYDGKVDFQKWIDDLDEDILDFEFEAKEIAIFYSPYDESQVGKYIVYKILPLCGLNE